MSRKHQPNWVAREQIGRSALRRRRYASCSENVISRITNSLENTYAYDPTNRRDGVHRAAARFIMRDDYLREALKVIDDPNILVNVISTRVKQLKRGNRALVESLEKLLPEDIALREVIEGKISYELPVPETALEEETREAWQRSQLRYRRPIPAATA